MVASVSKSVGLPLSQLSTYLFLGVAHRTEKVPEPLRGGERAAWMETPGPFTREGVHPPHAGPLRLEQQDPQQC